MSLPDVHTADLDDEVTDEARVENDHVCQGEGDQVH